MPNARRERHAHRSPLGAILLSVSLLATMMPATAGATAIPSTAPDRSVIGISDQDGSPDVSPAPDASPAPAPDASPAPQSDASPAAAPTPAAAPGTRPGSLVGPAAVHFPFAWRSPARTLPAKSRVTAGGRIGVRFSLGGNKGLGILADRTPTSQRYDCRTGAPIAGSKFQTRPQGAQGLTYNRFVGTYTYTWQTREDWSNTCRLFRLQLSDGSVHVARFSIATFHFIAPLAPLGASNHAIAGAITPVRFHMAASAGFDIFKSGYPRSAQVDCTTGARIGPWSRTNPHGTSGLIRSATSHNYRYSWQTLAAWDGTCRTFEMKLKDSSVEVLKFQFDRPPHAVDDSGAGFTTDEATAFTTANVLDNDSDPDGHPLSVTGLSTAGTAGSVTDNGDGTFGYDPDGAFEHVGSGGTDTDHFDYTVSNGHGGTATATVTITVTGINDAPVIADQTRSVAEDAANGDPVGSPLTFDDPDTSDGHTFAITAGDTGDAFAISDTGQITVADASQLDHEATASYSLTVEVTDDGSPVLSDSATVIVDVTDVNDRPVATDASVGTDEDTALSVDLGSLVSDAETSDANLTYEIVTPPSHGSVTGAGSSKTYTPDPDYNGSDSLDYRVTDRGAPDDCSAAPCDAPRTSATKTVSITVDPVNDRPAAGDTSVSVDKNSTVPIDLSALVSDTETANSGLTFTIDTPPAHGSYDPGDGSYTPDTNFTGSDSFAYSVTDRGDPDDCSVAPCDGPLASTPGTVTITVDDVNGAPVVSVPEAQVTDEDTSLVFSGGNGDAITVNDLDAGGADLTLTLTTTTGTLTLGSTAGLALTTGDGTADATMVFDGTLSELDDALDGLTFTPPADANGSATITVAIDDNGHTGPGGAKTDSRDIAVGINPVNDAPSSSGTSVNVNEDGSLPIDLGALASDVETADADLTYDIVSAPAHGTLTGSGATKTYTPDADYNGPDSFTYSVTDRGDPDDCSSAPCDAAATSATNTVTVTVDPVNDQPSATDTRVNVDEDGSLPIDLTALASDVETADADMTYAIAQAAGHGTLTVVGASATYTPAADYYGSDSFTYAVTDRGDPDDCSATPCDAPLTSATMTVTITVDPVNDAPVNTVPAGPIVPVQDVPTPIAGLSIADIDVGSDDISVTFSGDHGTLTLSTSVSGGLAGTQVTGNGTASVVATAPRATINATLADANGLVYQSAPPSYLGPDLLTMTTSDLGHNGSGGAMTDTDTVALVVRTPNAPPVAADLNPTTNEDTATTVSLSATDADGDDPLSFAIATGPSHGTLGTIGSVTCDHATPNGCTADVLYTPNADYNGPDSFTYTASDGSEDSAAATVSITVDAVNDAATATNLSAAEAYTEDTSLNLVDIVVTDVDSSTVTATLTLSNPAAGGLSTGTSNAVTSSYVPGTGVWTASGATTDVNTLLAGVVFTPTANFNASFTIGTSVTDGIAAAATGSKVVTGTPVNDPPTSTAPASVLTAEDTGIPFTGGNGLTVADVDGSNLTVVLTASNGTLTISTLTGLAFTVGDGTADPAMTFSGTQTALNAALATLTHAPTADFNGASTLTSSTSDGVASPVVKVVSLTITPVADIVADSVTTLEDTPLTFNAITGTNGASADNFENAGRAVSSVTQGTIGTVGFLTNGSLTYTPTLNANGPDSFSYTVTSGGVTETATVSVTVTPVNDAPVAAAQTLTTSSGIRVTIGASDTGKLKTGATDVDDPTTDLTVNATFTNVDTGATVTLTDAATGTYTYNPAAGFTGTDTFNYQVCDDGLPTAPVRCGTGSVTVTVNGTDLWFVDDSAAAGGTGRLTDPFQSLTALPAGRGAGDRIFVFSGTYATGHTLLASEQLIGQGASGSTFDTLLGVVVPANGTLATRPSLGGTAPTLGNTVNLATNAKVQGVAIASTTNTAMTNPAAVTGVTVSQTSLTTTTGTALLLSNVGGTLDFTNISKNGAGTAISLTTVNANTTVSAGTIQNTSTGAVFIDGGSGNVSYAGSLASISSGRAVTVQNKPLSATVTFSGALGSFGNPLGGTGILLDNNDQGGSGGSVTFSGGVNLSTGANAAFTATNGGTVSVTGSPNSLATTTGTALSVANTTIGSSALTFRSVSAGTGAGSAGVGISLDNTGASGGLHVTGTGAAGSGGTIQHKTGADGSTTGGIGIYLNNTADVQLAKMQLNDFDNFAVRGINVTGFTLSDTAVNGANGNNSGFDEGSVIFDGLLGTSSFSSDAISGSVEDNLRIRNSSGTATNIVITGSTFTNAPNDNIIIEPSGTANVTTHITGNTFTGAGGDHLQTATTNSASLTVVFTGNHYSNGFAGSLGGGVTISGGNAGSNETVNFNVSNNGSAGNPLVGNVQGGAININKGGGGGTWQGAVSNNFIGNAAVALSGSAQASGIRVENHSPTGVLTATVSGNVIRQWGGGAAINSQAGDAGNSVHNSVLNLTVTNNTATNPGPATQHGFVANIGAGGLGTNDASIARLDIQNNTLDGNAANGGSDLRIRQREHSTVVLPGYVGTTYDITAVGNYLISRNPGETTANATSSAGPGYVGGTVPTPTVPT